MKTYRISCPHCETQQKIDVEERENVLLNITYSKHVCISCGSQFEVRVTQKQHDGTKVRVAVLRQLLVIWQNDEDDLPGGFAVENTEFKKLGITGYKKLLEEKFKSTIQKLLVLGG